MRQNRGDDTETTDVSKPEASSFKAGLYVAATPIGNLKDITLRVLEALKAADMVVCEDTRVTGHLLQHYGIKASMLAYNDHNAASVRPKVMDALVGGKRVVLVSDAGTPLVSDPGYKLVEEAVAQGIDVISLPGASAMLAALVSSGLPSDGFFFAGFLPPKSAARKKKLETLNAIPGTLIFYESPRRMVETLADMAEVFGENRVAVMARELTKRFEEVVRAPLQELHNEMQQREEIKGEVVLLVAPPAEEIHDAGSIDAALKKAMQEMSVKEAAAFVAQTYGLSKNDLYRRALELKE
jgi:16S rRNA (cytidine1402-2'-O)-methyltransferase